MNKAVIGLLVALVALLGLIAGVLIKPNEVRQIMGSVSQSGEYHATSTSASTITKELRLGFDPNDLNAIKKGTFGSVIMTGTMRGEGLIEIYDATTTNILARTGGTPSSSFLLTSIPTENSTGTYTYDVAYQNGLIMVITGIVPKATVTYR